MLMREQHPHCNRCSDHKTVFTEYLTQIIHNLLVMMQTVTKWQMSSAAVDVVRDKPCALHPPRKLEHGPKFLL